MNMLFIEPVMATAMDAQDAAQGGLIFRRKPRTEKASHGSKAI
ncbi:MAG: hypothetical protein ACREFR_19325 [Limisphaerales bacterium]